MSSTVRQNTLWMGDLEPYMDEKFIADAYTQMGETVVSVKLIRSKHNGNRTTDLGSNDLSMGRPVGRLPAGYCFVEFPDPTIAHKAMLRLNGKIIPGSVPPKRYKLNLASFGREHLLIPEYSLFVGDLTEDVDDYQLYTSFSSKFKSCRAAKIVLDENGISRGYGFVRFTDETDQQRALREMNQYKGLGKRLIRVSLATPKRPMHSTSTQYPNYNPYYLQQQQYYANWWQQYQQPGAYYGYDNYNTQDASAAPGTAETQTEGAANEEDETLEDPCLEIDVDKLNQEFMNSSEELYTALEGSRWHPLDTVMSTISATAN